MLSSFPFASLFCESQSLILSTLGMVHWKFTIWTVKYDKSCLSAYLFRKSLFEIISDRNYLIFDMIHTVAYYRPSTVQLYVRLFILLEPFGPKIQQTKMLVTCQRFGDWFLFGLVWQYSSYYKTYNKGRFKVIATCLQQ